ncbi:MAG: hypothetical protein D6719_02825 [Candidatus Dadabacteria bacterium]|nr:MAG: hypothetical protein D6719_02825 [Candidatus Dadabacteria bacterium]
MHITPVITPEYDRNKGVPIEISSIGVKEARLLVANKAGYKIIDMKKDGDRFIGFLKFQSQAKINYRIQVKTDDWKVYLSKVYVAREPEESQLQNYLDKLREETLTIKDEVSDARDELHSIELLTPAEIVATKQAEKYKLKRILKELSESVRVEEEKLLVAQKELQGLLHHYNGPNKEKMKKLLLFNGSEKREGEESGS